MPGVLAPVSYEQIRAVRTQASSAAFPAMRRAPEAATQTFNLGVPCKLDANGNIIEATFAGADIIFGVNGEPPHNLVQAATAQDLSEGTPTNQASAITTPIGAWIRDGNIGTYEANGETVFSIALKVGQTFAQTLMVAGTLYGLTKDATSKFWFLDTTVTSGNSAVAILLGLDNSSPNTAAGGARVFFMFAAAKRYFN